MKIAFQVAFALASTGVASVELKGGKTVHKQFKVPINLNSSDAPCCNISRQSPIVELIRQCKVVLIDEATMLQKKAYEAIDRTLQDLLRNDHVFGGKVVIFSGDWKQTLPVLPKASRATVVGSTLKSTSFWRNIKQKSLTQQV